MRILLVNARFHPGGGDSTYLFNLADLLEREGHQIACFAMQDDRNLPDPNSDLFVSNIDFRNLNKTKDLANGIKVLKRSIYSTEARRKFRILLDRFHPDIVHLQNIGSQITPSILFEAKKHNLPVIWTLHDYGMICPNSHLLNDHSNKVCEACRGKNFYQAIFTRCKKSSLLASLMAATVAYANRLMRVQEYSNGFIAPSNFLRCKLIEYGFSAEKTHHLPLFIRDENFRPRSRNGKYLLFLGRLISIKGIYVLLEACRLAPDIPAILAGGVEEPLASEMKNLLAPNVKYVGSKNGDDLSELIDNCLAVVVPSVWYENQPFSILEAFASRKPVIASNLGGMTELVSQGERGLLTIPGSPQSLSEAMKWAISNVSQVHEMGENAYEYALKNHSSKAHYDSLLNIYEALAPKLI
jgi:glycosyltransferase involved in cell wall biosynthesis